MTVGCVWNEPYLKLHYRHENGHCSVGMLVKFVCTTGKKIFERHYLSQEGRYRTLSSRYGYKTLQ